MLTRTGREPLIVMGWGRDDVSAALQGSISVVKTCPWSLVSKFSPSACHRDREGWQVRWPRSSAGSWCFSAYDLVVHMRCSFCPLVIPKATKARGFLRVAEELLSMQWKQFPQNFPGFIYHCIFRLKDRLAFTSNLVEWIWRKIWESLLSLWTLTLVYFYLCVRMGKEFKKGAVCCPQLSYLPPSETSCTLNEAQGWTCVRIQGSVLLRHKWSLNLVA